MKLKIVNPLDIPNWDSMVAELPGATIFHTSAWARVLSESYGYTPTYFVSFDNGLLSAVIPMMDVNSWLTGHRGVSLPFTDYVDPLSLSGFPGGEGGFDDIVAHGREMGWKRIEFRLPGSNENRSLTEGTGFTENDNISIASNGRDRHSRQAVPPRVREDDYSAQRCEPSMIPSVSEIMEDHTQVPSVISVGSNEHSEWVRDRKGPLPLAEVTPWVKYFSHELDLRGGYEALWKTFRDSTKRNIKKAAKEGVTVEIRHDDEAVREFFVLNLLTRRDHGLPPQPDRFFKKVYEHIISKELGFVAIASFKGNPIAANVYFHIGNKAVYKYGASDAHYQNLRANNLVMWEAIRWYCDHGFENLCFGRTDLHHDGLRRFKTGWGAAESLITYHRYDVKKKHLSPVDRQATRLMRPSSAGCRSGSFASWGMWHTDIWDDSEEQAKGPRPKVKVERLKAKEMKGLSLTEFTEKDFDLSRCHGLPGMMHHHGMRSGPISYVPQIRPVTTVPLEGFRKPL